MTNQKYLFIDWNAPDLVYIGTTSHMLGCNLEGGDARSRGEAGDVSPGDTVAVGTAGGSDEYWPVEQAPDSWVESYQAHLKEAAERPLIQRREKLEEVDSEIAAKRAILERRQARIDKQLGEVEEEWLKSHECSCGLWELDCTHGGHPLRDE